MKKILFFLFTLALGLLLGELLRHKKMSDLKELAAREMRREARYARDEQAWEAELAAMPFEERMEWELFEAALKQSNYKPDWDEDDTGDSYVPQT